jgi:hypothetical protein
MYFGRKGFLVINDRDVEEIDSVDGNLSGVFDCWVEVVGEVHPICEFFFI